MDSKIKSNNMEAHMSFNYWEAPIIRRKKTPTEIIDVVAEEMNMHSLLISANTRKREVVDARRIIAYYLCKNGNTLQFIGSKLNRHYSTIIALRDSYTNLYLIDKSFKKLADSINVKLP